MFDLYRSHPVLVCFDGEPVDPPPGDPPPGDPPPADKTFTQAEVNKILAEDKRKHQAQAQKLEAKLNETLTNVKLTQEERAKADELLEDLRKQFRTKEETAKIERKQLEDKYTNEITTLKTRAEQAENKYVDSTISRAIQDAAVSGDAFSPNQIVVLLRPMTKMVGDNPMVDFPDVEADTGNPIVKQMTPTEAVQRMKQLVDVHGNLFKSNVVSGVGAGSSTGGTPGSGKVDVKKLTMEQFLQLRKTNPKALGL